MLRSPLVATVHGVSNDQRGGGGNTVRRERQFLAGRGIPGQLLPDHGTLGRTDLGL
jgi:hypothetical protein